MGRRRLSSSDVDHIPEDVDSIPETQEMLDFRGQHNITADIEIIPIKKVNEAYDRLLKSDVKYRFVVDMAFPKFE